MTDAEFATLMDTYLNNLSKKGASAWSKDARTWCEDRDIIAGISKGNYSYKSFATREQVATFLYRLADYLEDLETEQI